MNSVKYVYHYPLSYDDCSIKVYRSIFHKLLLLTLLLQYPIMLAFDDPLYVGIIGGSLYGGHDHLYIVLKWYGVSY